MLESWNLGILESWNLGGLETRNSREELSIVPEEALRTGELGEDEREMILLFAYHFHFLHREITQDE